MDRIKMIRKIESGNKIFDFIIIGGGATGIGTLLEAVSKGYSAILFEADDFTKSTSSKSTKLVHGGVRYLAQGNIGLVREASIERGRLMRNAPHIVKNLSFIIPTYTFFDKLMYLVGLIFYDLLAGSYSLGRSKKLSRNKVLEKLPNLKIKSLNGGILYHDGQFDDSRLAISLLKTAYNLGGLAINYMPVTKLFKDKNGKLDSVEVKDMETDQIYQINGKVIVNATGVFADSIMEMDHKHHKKSIIPSQGIHIVVDKKFLQSDSALMIPKTDDGRVLFAVPWHNKVVIGTTDTPVEKITNEPVALDEEIGFILSTASKYLKPSPGRKDILSVFAGLRPLAASEEGKTKTKEISRSHKIITSESGLLTIIGGKWTTYRKMAEDLLKKAEKLLEKNPQISPSRKLKIFGYQEATDFDRSNYFYGSEKEALEDLGEYEMISESLKISKNQIIYAVKTELARNPEDVLARRTRAILLDAKESIRISESVANIMAKELKKDTNWIEKQILSYKEFAKNYVIIDE